jgi:hypothetical protein
MWRDPIIHHTQQLTWSSPRDSETPSTFLAKPYSRISMPSFPKQPQPVYRWPTFYVAPQNPYARPTPLFYSLAHWGYLVSRIRPNLFQPQSFS